MKLLNKYNIQALSKILYRTEIMPSGNPRSFIDLSKKLIINLQNGYDTAKLKRVVFSELIATYGLSINEKQAEEITEIVSTWYAD